MKSSIGVVVAGALGLLGASCMSYSGVSKGDGQQIYVSGGMTYVFITIPFIKRCEVDGTVLKCEELAEQPAQGSRPRSTDPGGGTLAPPPAPSAAPAAPAKK
ncbi:MAG TPA: hypothetical protein VIF62_28550 [Labilithrix sp.]|jgi:hypothetical protein